MYFENEVKAIFSLIEKNNDIVIFGHKNPDGDCVGSILGLKYALKEFYPNKNIYAVGSRPNFLSFIEKSDEVSDEIIKSALCIMVDLSDLDRVEDQRIRLSNNIVCFDHHEKSSEFPYPILRDTTCISATMILAKVILEKFGSLNEKSATYFYLGLTTDSNRFQYNSEAETLDIGKKLIEHNANYKWIYENLYKQDSKDLRFKAYVYANFKFDGKVAYFVLRKEDYHKLNLNEQEAGCKVNLISSLDNHPLWAEFCELENGNFRVELRSDGHYNVQKVAVKFNGGGHIPASGCQISSIDQVQAVIDELNKAEAI